MNQELLELIAEVRRLSNQPKRASHVGFLLAMLYASLKLTEQEQFLSFLEQLVKARPVH